MEDEDDEDAEDDLVEPSDAPPSPAEEGLSETEKDEMLSQNTLALEAQVEERPLAKKQEELQETAKEEAAEKAEHDASESPSAENGSASTPPEQHEKREKPVQKALLKNDDSELDRIQQVRLGTGFPTDHCN